MSKFIKIIFTISVLLNLILVGVIAGNAYRMYQHRPDFQNMDDRTRELVKENIKSSREEMRQSFKEMREKSEALVGIMTAENFDKAAFQKHVSDILVQKDKMARKRAEAMGDMLSSLPQPERQKMSKMIIRSLIMKPHKPRPRQKEGRFGDKE